MSSEIPETILNLPTALVIGNGLSRHFATVQDLRDILLPLGLEITTSEAISWDTQYPQQARNITRICELNQQIETLQAERDGLLAVPVPIEKKEAAE